MIDKHDWKRICYLRLDLQRDFINTRVHNTRCIKHPSNLLQKMLAKCLICCCFFCHGSFLLRQGDRIFWRQQKKIDPQAEKRWTPIQKNAFAKRNNIHFNLQRTIRIYLPRKSGVSVSWPPFEEMSCQVQNIHPGKSTWSLKMMLWKRNFNCEIFTSPF